MGTLSKLPQVKHDLVKTDEEWEKWNMEKLIDNIQSWLKRNKPSHENHRRERSMYTRQGGEKMERKVSVYFVSQIIGMISANYMLLVTNGRSSLLRTDSVSIAPHPDVKAVSAAAVVLLLWSKTPHKSVYPG